MLYIFKLSIINTIIKQYSITECDRVNHHLLVGRYFTFKFNLERDAEDQRYVVGLPPFIMEQQELGKVDSIEEIENPHETGGVTPI